jgi:hypothetical protein
MPHFTDLQLGLICFVFLTCFVLSGWALFIVIPNRNETIRALRDRNQTLNYWVSDLQDARGTRYPLTGSQLERKRGELLALHSALNDQLRKCLIDIEYYNSEITKSKVITDEQQ